MKNEQQRQAQNLYFQTSLSKTQIAELLNVSRTSLHSWIKEGNWDRLKNSATHLPSLLAENCYHVIGRFTEHLLSEDRAQQPVTRAEADTLHKLTLTVNKLKNRTTLNENMEMFAFFMDALNKKDPRLAQEVSPHVEEYIAARASVYRADIMPATFDANGNLPGKLTNHLENRMEEQLDELDLIDWEKEKLEQSTPEANTLSAPALHDTQSEEDPQQQTTFKETPDTPANTADQPNTQKKNTNTLHQTTKPIPQHMNRKERRRLQMSVS